MVPVNVYSSLRQHGLSQSRRGEQTFNSAKVEHSSHSLFTWVTPPISRTAGFVLPIEEVGELAVGEAEELDDIFPLISHGTINNTALSNLAERTKLNSGMEEERKRLQGNFP